MGEKEIPVNRHYLGLCFRKGTPPGREIEGSSAREASSSTYSSHDQKDRGAPERCQHSFVALSLRCQQGAFDSFS